MVLQISRQSIEARMSYSDFKKCCEKKNTKKIRRSLKAHISGKAWRIQFKFGIRGATPQGNSHRKFRVFLFRECWATDAWKRHFLYSCKIHTCLSRAPGFLGRTTHYRVCWYNYIHSLVWWKFFMPVARDWVPIKFGIFLRIRSFYHWHCFFSLHI